LKLFIDTWGWLTLRDRKEPQHQEVKEFYSQIRKRKGIIYTSDYVLDETITLLFRRLPFKASKGSLATIDNAIKDGYIQMEWVTPDRFERAKGLRLKYQDKPKISFTDFTTMVIMKDLSVKGIVSEDGHFEHVGMGFRRKP